MLSHNFASRLVTYEETIYNLKMYKQSGYRRFNLQARNRRVGKHINLRSVSRVTQPWVNRRTLLKSFVRRRIVGCRKLPWPMFARGLLLARGKIKRENGAINNDAKYLGASVCSYLCAIITRPLRRDAHERRRVVKRRACENDLVPFACPKNAIECFFNGWTKFFVSQRIIRSCGTVWRIPRPLNTNLPSKEVTHSAETSQSSLNFRKPQSETSIKAYT